MGFELRGSWVLSLGLMGLWVEYGAVGLNLRVNGGLVCLHDSFSVFLRLPKN